MTPTADRLFTLACQFAQAQARAERHRVLATLSDNDEQRAKDLADADRFAALTALRRERLRRTLNAFDPTRVLANPDHDNPVGVHHGNLVELRAHAGERRVLVRYTLAQALVVGTEMIAHAAAAEARTWGSITDLLAECAPRTGEPAPTPRTEGRS